MFELKRLSPEAVPAALEKALRYRLLNEPEQAASICEDVLRIAPDNQAALTTLILALTDCFGGPRPVPPKSVRDLLPQLREAYDREYYAGIIWEREAVARMRSHAWSGPAAFDCFHQAMDCYDRAAGLRPAGNDDALLRWNGCARMIMNHPDIHPDDEATEVPTNLGE